MAVTLFLHNQAAYDAVIDMMAETGKACVIHPTGTGKSFIGFRYAEEHPGERILWLAPSEYIFWTQMENWRAAGGEELPNITFFTYAKLMVIPPEDMRRMDVDTICVDEFHRLGAPEWGKAFKCFLESHSDIRLLGLTATNIRYLDSQRDMADELFEGCVASEMTLGEAIVRGILNPPKYVFSLFTYQDELEKYEARIRKAQSKAVRDRGEELLESLRRTLEKAEGMDVIFGRHMAEKTGKYLVFCANAEHMREMIARAPEWFGKVDADPHIYSAYSADPQTSKAFAAFKADESEHLKLLYCIDMLNEGIHVENVSGVILLRPTVSPIIYKQQIGRALSTSQRRNAVIFDIVLNIENLFSISAVQEEMEVATAYYRSLGLEREIINDQFHVIDEVRDCMELFEQLENTLTASWELMYQAAKRYRAENGDLNVPMRYVTAEGYSLGRWLSIQRMVRSGKINGRLTEQQISQLDALGMRWENANDMSWDRYYRAAKEYFEAHGDLNVPMRYVTQEGLKLGNWLNNLRQYQKNEIRNAYLTDDRVEALNAIGMRWDVLDYLFEKNFAAACAYYSVHRNLDVPMNYVDKYGMRLGLWICNLRRRRNQGRLRLTESQIRRLDALGMRWENRQDVAWDRAYNAARCYWEQHGDLNVPKEYSLETGFKLGRWVRRQRKSWKDGMLPEIRKERLNAIGMQWR